MYIRDKHRRLMKMRAVAIDPMERRIVVEDVDPTPGELRRLCGAPPRVVARLPNGDVLLAREGERSWAGFSIGGSKAIRRPVIVLGKRDAFGERTGARSSAELLQGLVRWLEPEPAAEQEQPGETIKVILIDPEAGTIDYVDVDRTMAGIDALVGGQAVPLMRAPGDDVVYGRSYAPGWRWRKDDCVFNDRCVIAGSDRMNSLMDPVASVEILRRTVEFGPPGRSAWMSYHKHAARLSDGQASL
jgi:hypothetical protein